MPATQIHSAHALPYVIDADHVCGGANKTLQANFAAIETLVQQYLQRTGAVLMRGFDVPAIDCFREFAAAFGDPLLRYEFGSTPRSKVGEQGVYTSTEYPAHQHIPLHNEQAYTTEWPMKLWFHCVETAEQGGETPLADSRRIFSGIPADIRQRFIDRKLMYVRNYGNGLDVSWTQVFNTTRKSDVEQYCRQHNIKFEWKDDGELRTGQICQSIARHPQTRELVWFNQAHLFHVSNLEPEVQEALLDIVAAEDLPRNVYYGDGSSIEASVLDQIRAIMDQQKVIFPWQRGDVLMLDNMLVAHARQPYEGAQRKVVVAMAQTCSSAGA